MYGMIERVARAIYEGRNGAGCRAWGSLPTSHRDPYLKDARVALEATREPTEEMEAAFVNTTVNRWATLDGLRDGYRAMIDAALKEGGE